MICLACWHTAPMAKRVFCKQYAFIFFVFRTTSSAWALLFIWHCSRASLALTRRLRALSSVLVGYSSCRANPLCTCLLCVCQCLHHVKPNALKPHPRGCPNPYPLTCLCVIMFTRCRAIGPVISSRMIAGIAHYLRCRMFPTTVQRA